MRAKSKKGKQPATPAVRYASYIITLLLVISMPILFIIYQRGYATTGAIDAYLSIALSLFFPSIAISYMLAKGNNMRSIVQSLGLSRDGISRKNLAISVLLFLLIFVTEVLVSVFSAITGIPLPTNVGEVLLGMPFYFLIFAVIIAPINEEIFFRGFLVPRAGILISAALFSVPHLLTYSSISELFAAFVFGVLAGYFFRRTKSLYPAILAHMLVNLLAIAAITLV